MFSPFSELFLFSTIPVKSICLPPSSPKKKEVKMDFPTDRQIDRSVDRLFYSLIGQEVNFQGWPHELVYQLNTFIYYDTLTVIQFLGTFFLISLEVMCTRIRCVSVLVEANYHAVLLYFTMGHRI